MAIVYPNPFSYGSQSRILVKEDLHLYANLNGNDRNRGESESHAFLNPQTALNLLNQNYDLGGHKATIHLGPGTFHLPDSISLVDPVGADEVIIEGSGFDGDNATILDGGGTLKTCIHAQSSKRFTIQNLGGTNATHAVITCSTGSEVTASNIHSIGLNERPFYLVGGCSLLNLRGTIQFTAPPTPDRSIKYGLLSLAPNGTIDANGTEFVFINNPYFSQALAAPIRLSQISLYNTTIKSGTMGGLHGYGISGDGRILISSSGSPFSNFRGVTVVRV